MPQDRHPSSADDSYSRVLGPVAKVRALLSSEATYIREIRNDECESDPKCRKPTSRDKELAALLRRPVAIQIQFPRGAKLRVGDTIFTFSRRHLKDAAGERSEGYGFTAAGASLPLRYWSDETDTSLRGNDTRVAPLPAPTSPGWSLIEPHVVKNRPWLWFLPTQWTVEVTSPLREWRIISAEDTAKACTEAQLEHLRVTRNPWRQVSGTTKEKAEFARHAAATAKANSMAQCVNTDDARLKPRGD